MLCLDARFLLHSHRRQRDFEFPRGFIQLLRLRGLVIVAVMHLFAAEEFLQLVDGGHQELLRSLHAVACHLGALALAVPTTANPGRHRTARTPIRRRVIPALPAAGLLAAELLATRLLAAGPAELLLAIALLPVMVLMIKGKPLLLPQQMSKFRFFSVRAVRALSDCCSSRRICFSTCCSVLAISRCWP